MKIFANDAFFWKLMGWIELTLHFVYACGLLSQRNFVFLPFHDFRTFDVKVKCVWL